MAIDEEMENNPIENPLDDEELSKSREVLDEQELLELETYIRDQRSKIEAKMKLREENMNCERPDERFFLKLDASLKKNTAFVKKMKQFTASQLDAFLKDMSGLNLNKYISEICAALSEAKLKMTDVNAVVILCSKLHQTYNDFDSQFLEAWQKILPIKAGDKISNSSKMRVDLRLFAELVSCGVINAKQGLQMLGGTIVNIVGQDKEGNSFFPIILSFCRHCGEEYAGLIPRRILQLSEKYDMEIPRSDFLQADKQLNLKSLLKDYFKIICKHLLKEREELMNMTRNVRHTIESKGEISNDKKEKCELMQANFDKLYTSAQTLSDLINEPLPDFAKETEICNPGTVIENILEDTTTGELDPWGDEETKSFYTDLPDLRQFLPNFSAPKVDLEQIEEPAEMTEEALDAEIDADIDMDDPPSTASDPVNEKDLETCEEVPPLQPLPDKIGNALMAAGRLNAGASGVNKKQQFDVFLTNLNNCVNKELIDSAAIEFLLNYNTKNNRKKLTKAIFGVQRTRLDLLPFLSRFVAIVNMCNTDVAIDLSEMLRKEFKWHIRMKNQLNIESKIKIVRFIGEMTKFGLCKKFDALGCLKMLLRDFQHHQIEMACAFIEVAGVYLYNCKDSRLLTNVFLDQMMRLKKATAMDSRHSAQIENVFYLVKPPTSIKQDIKIRPDIHEYIRHLIFEELSKSNVSKCIKLMSRLNWNDPSVSSYAIKCLSKAYLIRYPLIRWLADLVVGLSAYQEKAVSKVIDNVFEDIRAGLEIHSPKLAQRRIAMARYLGELYNYKLLDGTHILNTLYSIISLGVSTEEGVYSEIDPPDSLFRIKLACTLLDTCGQYFTGPSSNRKLDYFLVFFQHYYWYKKSHPIFKKAETNGNLFPILVEHIYRDCLSSIRPKLKHYKSLKEAKAAVDDLKKKLYPKLKATLEETQTGERGLQTIREDSEIEVEAEVDDAVSDDSSTQCDGRIRENNVAREKNVNSNDDDDEDAQTECTLNAHDQANLTDLSDTDMITDEFGTRECEKTKEDLEFEQMFEKMAADSYQERLKESIKANTKDIPVPMTAKVIKKSYDQIGSSHSGSSLETKEPSASSQSAVQFTLMVRGGKGGKHQFKQFAAPPDSHLAINLKLQEEKIREEKEKVKRLTLNITERIEEEDYQESLMQNQRNTPQVHFQRTIKPKFRHQKGAPDADLIFN